MIALYFVYILFEALHQPFDMSVIEKKAALLVLPIAFTCSNFTQKKYRQILSYFVYGTLIACIICYFNAFFNSLSFIGGLHFDFQSTSSLKNNFLESSMYGGNHFFGDNFSIFHQSVYFALFINISVIILLFTDIIKLRLILKYTLLLFFGLIIFQISNRVNIVVFFLLLLFRLLTVNGLRVKLILFFSVLVFGSLILFNNPRTKVLIDKVINFELVTDREAENSFGTRILVWDASLNVIKNNLALGVGFSNAYNQLQKVYKEKRYVVPYRNRLNSHNQYLQIVIECGVLGLMCLLIIQYVLLPKVNNKHRLFSLYFLLIININFLFESVLNRYSGLICFAFFYCCIIGLKKNELELDS
ncbi:O-antigen ligase family protein [Lacinutrix sp.]|uniref:O-antigen ligase family protein n=1 Tax=Lacinutrix sp. TaxID=1937692 RepID=UPI0030EC6DA4